MLGISDLDTFIRYVCSPNFSQKYKNPWWSRVHHWRSESNFSSQFQRSFAKEIKRSNETCSFLSVGHWKTKVFEKVTTCSFPIFFISFLFFFFLVGYRRKNTEKNPQTCHARQEFFCTRCNIYSTVFKYI